jgi:hypothetical protein
LGGFSFWIDKLKYLCYDIGILITIGEWKQVRSYENIRNNNVVRRTLEQISKEEKSAEYQQARRLFGDNFRARVTTNGVKFLVYPAGTKYDVEREKNVVTPLLNSGGNLDIDIVYNNLLTFSES